MLTLHKRSIITVTVTTAKRENPIVNAAASAVSMDPACEGFMLLGAWTVAVAVCLASSIPLGYLDNPVPPYDDSPPGWGHHISRGYKGKGNDCDGYTTAPFCRIIVFRHLSRMLMKPWLVI